MDVQVSGIPLQLQEEGPLLVETLIDRDMWENLCLRTKAKQARECLLLSVLLGRDILAALML